MKFQYIISIILWSLYVMASAGILWAMKYNGWVIQNLDLSQSEFYYFGIVFIIFMCTGIYKAIEKIKIFRKYLTYKGE